MMDKLKKIKRELETREFERPQEKLKHLLTLSRRERREYEKTKKKSK